LRALKHGKKQTPDVYTGNVSSSVLRSLNTKATWQFQFPSSRFNKLNKDQLQRSSTRMRKNRDIPLYLED